MYIGESGLFLHGDCILPTVIGMCRNMAVLNRLLGYVGRGIQSFVEFNRKSAMVKRMDIRLSVHIM